MSYHRPDWQRIVRHAPRRVRDAGDVVRCGLWALGLPLADHLELTPDGELARVLTPTAPPPQAPIRLPGEVWTAVVAVVVAESLPPLAPSIREVARDLVLEWAPLDRDLARIEGARGRVDPCLRRALAELIAAAPDARTRTGLALATLAEIAGCVGDALRGRAQAWLAAQPEAEQRAALETLGQPHAAGPEEARAIAAGVEALLADVR